MAKKLKSPFALHGAHDASTLFNSPSVNSETIISNDNEEAIELQEGQDELSGNIPLIEQLPQQIHSNSFISPANEAKEGEELEEPPLLEGFFMGS